MIQLLHSRRNKLIAAFLAILLLIAAILGIRALTQDEPDTDQNSEQIISAISLDYPAGWTPQEASIAEQKAGVMWKLQRTDPQANVVLRGVVSDLEDDFDINDLPSELEKTFKGEIKGFDLLDKSVADAGQYKIAQIKYDEKTEKQKQVYTSLMIVLPLEHQTFYLAYRTPQKDFSKIEKDFNTITNNLADYVKENTDQGQNL